MSQNYYRLFCGFFFSAEFYTFLKESKIIKNKILTFIIIVIWFIPSLFAFSNLSGRFTKDNDTVDLPPGIGYCFNSNVNNDDANKGIVSYVDYKCLSNNGTPLSIWASQNPLYLSYSEDIP